MINFATSLNTWLFNIKKLDLFPPFRVLRVLLFIWERKAGQEPYQANGAAYLSFRGDMPYAEAMTASRESAVCYQSALLPKSSTHDGRCGIQHFWHSRPTLWAFIPDDYDATLYSDALVSCHRNSHKDEEILIWFQQITSFTPECQQVARKSYSWRSGCELPSVAR